MLPVFGQIPLVVVIDGLLCTGVYFACVMIMCTISVTTTVIVLNFHHRSPEMYEMPAWVRTRF